MKKLNLLLVSFLSVLSFASSGPNVESQKKKNGKTIKLKFLSLKLPTLT